MLPEGEASPTRVFRTLLERRSRAFGLTFSDQVLESLARFLAELDRARRQTNLTGPMSDEALVDHALESGLGSTLIPDGAKVVDIGSGAGFPGLPLAITRPDLHVTPVEPRPKRADFLRHACRAIPLDNCSVVEGRLDKLAPGSWDVATARAVGSIERLLGEGSFLRPGGLFLAWTTGAVELAERLDRQFALEAQLPVPQSRKKVIASFRKADVPRGTGA
jgi:16S rRNA (guanine(527)-N(7))-methyltransferase RsmG